MAHELFTVRRIRKGSGDGKAKNYDSVSMSFDLTGMLVFPSVCEKDGVSDGLVNAEIWVPHGGPGAGEFGSMIKCWVEEAVATIEAYDD